MENGTYYYYILNLQGDVIRLIDGSGMTVALYEYDPYGKIVSASGSMASINPLRYRGYYYDNETHLYYCLSRYYDPQTGRFISPDSFASTGQGILGHNMFAYCNNNPILYCDEQGTFLNTAIGAVIGGAIGAINAWVSGDDILSGALIGAATGALAGAAADIAIATGGVGAVFIAAAGGAVSGGLSAGLTDVANGRDVNWTNVAIDSITGAVGGLLTFGTGGGSLEKVGKGLMKNMYNNMTTNIMKDTSRKIGKEIVKYSASRVKTCILKNLAFEVANSSIIAGGTVLIGRGMQYTAS